ncbi:MAG: O-antigen ligase family protein [Oscillospiraceae bacterium]|nr:O-antigen ligase family protein [Oscillospiraceae bacterium]
MRKTALWMTYLYFFICPLEFIFNRWFGSSVKYIALVAAAFILMFFIVSPKQPMKFGAIQICLGAWALFEAASYLWTIHSRHTLSMLITYLMMAVLVIAISLFPFEKKELEGVLLSYTLGCLILTILVLVFGKMWNDNASGRMSIQILGSYQDPNGLAANLLGGIFYSLHKIFEKPKRFPILNILFAVIWAVSSIAVFYTGSRGALVAYAVALIAFTLMRSSKKNRLIILLSASLAILIIYFILKELLPPALFNRLFDFSSYSGGSGRINIWLTALRKIVENPIVGFGVLSHQGFFYLERGAEVSMHNTFLFILFEVGIVGLTLFMIPFIKSLRCAIRHKNAMLVAIIIANIAVAFFLDALNLRYLWNAMMFGIIFYNCCYAEKVSPSKTFPITPPLPANKTQ